MWDRWTQYFIKLIAPAIWATLRMVSITMCLSFLLGFLLACLMILTHPVRGLRPNRYVYQPISAAVNMIRSLPFIILVVTIAPITRYLLGSMVGEAAAILPMTVGGVPFLARILENAMLEVDQGLVDAARSFGASDTQILFRVLLVEAVPSIINNTTLASINCVGATTMAGAVGAGGLGAVALNYGFYSFNDMVLYTCVVITLIFVQLIQVIGYKLYKSSLRS